MMDTENDDILELDTEVEDQPADIEQQDDTGDIAIEVDGEDIAAEDETPLVKKLRDAARTAQREAAELRKGKQALVTEAGPKPDLWEDCEGDPDKYEARLLQWHESKTAAERAQQQAQQQTQVTAAAFEKSKIDYRTKAQTVGIKGFDDAEAKVIDALGSDYLGAIIQYAPDPHLLVAALGTHQALLDRIVDEPDPIRRLFTLAQMGTKVKVTRKGPPPPEADTIVRGSAQLSTAAADKKADKLLEEAQKTGDMKPYRDYMRERRKA